MGLHAMCVLRTTDLKRIRVVIGDEAMLFVGYHVAMRLRSVFLLRRYAPLSFQLCLLGMPWGTSAAPVKVPGATCFTPAHAPTSHRLHFRDLPRPLRRVRVLYRKTFIRALRSVAPLLLLLTLTIGAMLAPLQSNIARAALFRLNRAERLRQLIP